MSRFILASLGVLLLGAPAAEAKRCSQLRDRDIAPAKHVILAEVANTDGGDDLVGCILPRGGLHTMASSTEYETESSDYTLLRVRREKIMYSESFGNQYGGSEGVSVADVRTTDSYTILSECREILVGFCPGPPQSRVTISQSRLSDTGQAAVVLLSGSEHIVAGFTAHGVRTELDRAPAADIDAASLRLRGSTVTWTHGGERTYTLDG